MIKSEDISFVVQGKNIPSETKDCLASIRHFFPQATIIFSTYTHENVQGLDFDILVRSKDPGAYPINKHAANQINRILLTSQAGLKHVRTKYCARLRSDLIFQNDKILNDWAAHFPKRNKKYAVFKERVCFFQLWTRLGMDVCGNYILTPFYFSDWFCFGLTEDVAQYYNAVDLVKEPAFTTYFKQAKNRLKKFYNVENYRQFDPEQYFGTVFFKQFFKDADLKNMQDFSQKKMLVSDKVLANNIVTLSHAECGIYIRKQPYSDIVKKTRYPETSLWLKDICTHYKFMQLYQKYCDPRFVFPLRYRFTQDLHIEERLRHLAKHWYAFKQPLRNFLKWAEQLLSCGSYALQTLACCVFYLPGFVYQELRESIKRK